MRIGVALFIAAVALAGCAAEPSRATGADYRKFSDEVVKLTAKSNGTTPTSDLDGYWANNKTRMKQLADTTCSLTLGAKTKAKSIALASASVEVADQGQGRRGALVVVQSSIAAARDHVCPQYDGRASEVLAYLATQIALED